MKMQRCADCDEYIDINSDHAPACPNRQSRNYVKGTEMPDEETDNEPLQMGLSITWRDIGEHPTAVMTVPLGGPDVAVVIGLNFEDPTTVMIEMSVSGFPCEEAASELLRAIADHMETMPSTRITDDGVEYKLPMRKAEDT